MTSNINFAGINEQFPVAGQDNDTQVFRDNFDTIKTSLRTAQTEITDLQNNVARTDQDTDFNNFVLRETVFQRSREKKFPGIPGAATYVSGGGVNWEEGSYHSLLLEGNVPVNMSFENLPGDPVRYPTETNRDTVGRMTLELKATAGSSVIINFVTSGGTVIKKDSSFPTTLTIDDSENPVFIEVWRHNSDTIYMRYLGKFS